MRTWQPNAEVGTGSEAEVTFGRRNHEKKIYDQNSAQCKYSLLVIAGIFNYLIYIYY